MSNRQTAAMLDKKLAAKTAKTMFLCGIVMICSVLAHDFDHIRQAHNWGYTIPLSLWVLNLTVYIFPVITIFLSKSNRMSATLVGAIGGIFTTVSFLTLHFFGSATGLWGIWNFSYFELMKGVTYQGNYYQGVDWLSWVLLFHIPVFCLPCSYIGFKNFFRLKREAKEAAEDTVD